MNPILPAVLRLRTAGLSILPIKPNGSKAPALSAWKEFEQRQPTSDELRKWFAARSGPRPGIAVVGGVVSGNLEIIDFDAPELIEEWRALAEEAAPGLLTRLPQVETPTGGLHVFYRCEQIAGNQKLAARVGADKKIETLIETRGEGGYVITAGSPAACHPSGKLYRLVHGDLKKIPTITPQERDVLLSCARSFNQHVKPSQHVAPERQAKAQNLQPGTDFNQRGDVRALLEKHGWRQLRRGAAGELWRRPGGEHTSATLFDSGALYVFSTNAEPFEHERSYSPFAIFATLEHGGDFQVAAKALAAQGYGEPAKPKAAKDATATNEADAQKLQPGYHEKDGELVLVKDGRFGVETQTLTNFTARIVADVTEDDGAERRRVFELEASLNGAALRSEVTAEEFAAMNWPVKLLGAKAIIYPNRKDYARTAIQALSLNDEIKARTVYAHTGWREIDGEWCYLHGGGAISATGRKDCAVRLPVALTHFILPDPPAGEALKAAIRAELQLLDLVPDEVGIPVLSAPFGAVLGEADYSHHLEGNTGWGKSMLAILVQQHFGAGFDKRNIPAQWEWTALALKELAFVAKDAVLLIDEFKPHGSTHDQARLHQKADDVLRGAANHSGRGKLNRDSSMRNARAPRGLIVSTGEDVPKGESLRARVAITQFEKTTMNWAKLTACQQHAAEGVYAGVLSAFIQWLAPRYTEVRKGAPTKLMDYRTKFSQVLTGHKRTPEIAAHQLWAWGWFFTFIESAEAITATEKAELWKRIFQAVTNAAKQQATYQKDEDPARRFIEITQAALLAGKCHVATLSGDRPINSASWGWRGGESQGERIGWLEDDKLYLNPDAAYTIATKNGSGEAVTTATTLWKRLRQTGYLIIEPGQDSNLVRKVVDGRRIRVLALLAAKLDAEDGESGCREVADLAKGASA